MSLIVVLAAVIAAPSFAANSLAVNPSAALNGTTYGLQVSFDGSTNNVYVQSDHPVDEGHYLCRFWVNPAGLSLANDTSIRMGAIGTLNGQGQHVIMFLRNDYPLSGVNQYLFNIWLREDTNQPSGATFRFGSSTFHSFTASPIARQYEIEWTKSSGVGADDGTLYVRRIAGGGGNPVVKSVTGLDTDLMDVDNIRIGGLSTSSNPGNGYYYFDEFESYR